MSTIEFNELLLSNTESLRPKAYGFTRDEEDAKDLLHDTIYRALANREKYNEGTNIQAWLYTIMRNTFINSYRRKAKEKKIFRPTPELYREYPVTGAGNQAESRLDTKEILAAVHALPELFRLPFSLYFEGYPYQQIAAMLGVALGTIKSRIHFARKHLREAITSQDAASGKSAFFIKNEPFSIRYR